MAGLTDYAVRSDFLVYWTGKDIDAKFDSDWADRRFNSRENASRTHAIVGEYIRRLRNVLKYGLWLTEDREHLTVRGTQVSIPTVPRACFTELKLSESRRHARQYGRLGIGFKRPYVFCRRGRPLAYFGFGSETDPFLEACVNDFTNRDLLNFFKPMNSGQELNYDLYSESEWRILFADELLKSKKVIDPRDDKNVDAHKYFLSLTSAEQDKLKYLVPLDAWFSVIIYPTLGVKNVAQQDRSNGIQEEIARIKNKTDDHANVVEGGNWPFEIDLNACRHF